MKKYNRIRSQLLITIFLLGISLTFGVRTYFEYRESQVTYEGMLAGWKATIPSPIYPSFSELERERIGAENQRARKVEHWVAAKPKFRWFNVILSGSISVISFVALLIIHKQLYESLLNSWKKLFDDLKSLQQKLAFLMAVLGCLLIISSATYYSKSVEAFEARKLGWNHQKPNSFGYYQDEDWFKRSVERWKNAKPNFDYRFPLIIGVSGCLLILAFYFQQSDL